MRRFMLLCLVVTVSCAAALDTRGAAPPPAAPPPAAPPPAAPPPPPTPTPQELRVLVACLSAYTPRTRREAFDKLMAHGESAEPILRQRLPAVRHEPETLARYEAILEHIDTHRRVRQMLEPTRVTLHFDDTPVRQVLASLYVRAGAEVRLFPPAPWESAGDQRVTVHFDKIPFWDAVARLEELTGLTLIDAGWGASFVKVRPELARGRVSVRGPFRIVAEDGPMPGSIRALKVFLEPKSRVVWHARQAKLAGLPDPRQREAVGLAWQLDRWTESRVAGKSADVLEVELPLAAVMRPLAHVKGTIPTVLAAREELVEDLAASEWGSIAIVDRTYTWNLRRPASEVHVLRVGPHQPVFGMPDAAQQLALAKELPAVRPMLYDARGTPLLRSPTVQALARESYEWAFHQRLPHGATWRPADAAGGADHAVTAQPPPPPCGPPARLKLALPTVTREIEIPFEFGQPPAPAPAP